jgi:uroporphyrinogen-III synthase
MKLSLATDSSSSKAAAVVAPANPPANRAGQDVDLAWLNEIAHRLSSAAPLDEVLAEVAELVTAVVACDSCMVYMLDGEELVLRVSRNPHPAVVNRLKMKSGQGASAWLAEHREPIVLTSGAFSDPRFKLFNELVPDRFEAFLSVPVASGGKLVGVINLQNRSPYSFTPREISLVSTLGYLIGAESERARLQSENTQLVDRLETRKLIERAKGILQRDLQLSEEDAYLTLQRESRQRRKAMKEVAEAIILSEELKHPK